MGRCFEKILTKFPHIWLWKTLQLMYPKAIYSFCLLYWSISKKLLLSDSNHLIWKLTQKAFLLVLMKFFIISLPLNQEPKLSVKDENGSAVKSNAPPKGVPPAPSSKAGSSTTASGPVSEEEIRAVLMQNTPVTTQDLVAKFKARLRSPEVSSI